MARTVTVADLVTRVRRLCDLEGSAFVTDAEVATFISDAWASLYRRVVGVSWGEEYYSSEKTVAVVAGTASYAVEADFYKLLAVEWLVSGSTVRTTLRRLNRDDMDSAREQVGVTDPEGYQLRAGSVVLFPTPTSAGTMYVRYIPAPAQLADGDSVDGVAGWDRFCVWRAVADVRAKEGDEGGHVAAAARASQEMAEIVADAPVRDGGEPLRVAAYDY